MAKDITLLLLRWGWLEVGAAVRVVGTECAACGDDGRQPPQPFYAHTLLTPPLYEIVSKTNLTCIS